MTQYIGNKRTKEAHDTTNPKSRCQVAKITNAGNAVSFIPDTLEEAHKQGYDNCAYCIGDSKR